MPNPVDDLDSYDTIGRGYTRHRRPDPRIAAQIEAALDGARRVVNVGAGTGAYEPEDADVVAVEPSTVMLGGHPGPMRVQGAAEALPLRDRSFDAALCSLTIHHWQDPVAGMAELRRVSARQVVFTFDASVADRFWLVSEYLPELADLEASRAPSLDVVAEHLDVRRVDVVPVPWDCTDGFQAAYWRRPERYLDPEVRAAISTMAQLPAGLVEAAVERLRADLASGRWDATHGDLLTRDRADYGYRLVVAGR